MIKPLTAVRQISSIAYGFMGKLRLVAALDVDLFGRLTAGAGSPDGSSRREALDAPGDRGCPQSGCKRRRRVCQRSRIGAVFGFCGGA